jgi:hypothetical protein
LDRPTRRWSLCRPDASQALLTTHPEQAAAHAEHWNIAGAHGGGGGGVQQRVSAYDAIKRSAEEADGPEALGAVNPSRVDMVDALPGFRPGTTGGRFY